MYYRKITAIVLILCMITSTALASVLGSETYLATSVEVSKGTTYVNNIFISDQTSVGKQNENYYIYEPNDTVVPAIVNDSYIYGKTKISDMAKKMKNDGLYPIMIMNSDFFSLKTGVQMGNQVVDRIIATKDSNGQDAVGIRTDGTAFMSWLQINTTLTVGDKTFTIENINKYVQPYSIYLLTHHFSNTTKSESPSYNVIIGQVSDDMTINSEITGVVEEITESDEPIKIPENKLVICVDKNLAADKLNNVKALKVGDEVTISNKFDGDARWSECVNIQGSIGGRLIKDGQIMDVDQDASPRSAIGITKDGKIIFYTIDGRQTGHSYGVRLKTLSKRLYELGCVDAINLDGGGSTSIMGTYPGYDDINLLNKPSDGSERKVATFFALVNTKEPTGIADKLHLAPYGGNYLSGTSEKFTVTATDENYYPATISGEVSFSANGGAAASNSGVVKLEGNGNVKVTAKCGELEGSTQVAVFSNPDDIIVYNNSKKVTSLTLKSGETVTLKPQAMVESKPLTADNSCFTWSATKTIGTIDNGKFTASQVSSSGNITVKAGNKTVSIPVTVTGDEYAAYTQAEFDSDSDSINVRLISHQGIGVEKENISVTIDGSPREFEYKNGVVTIERNSDKRQKLIIAYTNSMNKRSVKSYTADGDEYQNNFSDMNDHWSKGVVSYMNSMGIVNGLPGKDGTVYFNPDANMTRYEFAVMTANYIEIEASDFENAVLEFSDAEDIPQWAEQQVKMLVSMGIINGKTNSDGSVTFSGTDYITRAEAITVITRAFGEGLKAEKMDYNDIDDVPAYAKQGFETLIAMDVMSGYDDGTLKPNRKITRAEATKLMYGIY